MRPFKIALVYYDAPEVPGWIKKGFSEEGIELAIKQCTTREEVILTAHDAHAVWVFGGGRVLTADCLIDLPHCGLILRSGSGTDNIPVQESTRLGIIVANTPQATCEAVSDHAIALLLSVARWICCQNQKVKEGIWEFRATPPPVRLHRKVLGLIGFGYTAREVAIKMRGFSPRIIAYDPFVNSEIMEDYEVLKSGLDDLLRESDFVSLHCPLTKETFHLISERELRLMKPTSILVNNSRGSVIDEQVLIRAIQEGWIGGAGLDVLEQQPPSPDNPLLKAPNVVITPHMAGYAANHLEPFWQYSLETLIDVSRDRWPSSCVNPEVVPRWTHLSKRVKAGSHSEVEINISA